MGNMSSSSTGRMGKSKVGAGGGIGGGASFVKCVAEARDTEEALVDMDGVLEKVLPLVEKDCSDMRIDALRITASTEFFLVCEGDRLGTAGITSGAIGFPGAIK